MFSFVLAGCEPTTDTPVELSVDAPTNTTAGDGFHLSESEIDELEPKARAGDVEAARRLTDYYQLYVSDIERTTYWQRVGVKHGDALSTLNLASNLASRGTAESCVEAIALLARVQSTTKRADLRERAKATLSSITEGRYEPCRGIVPPP